MSARVLVFTATYDEAGNIESLVRAIFRNAPEVDLLVVDDGSPDGTGVILDRLAAADPRVSVIHRPRKSGLGSAHLLGVEHAVAHGYDVLVTMDADLSHDPKYLPTMLGLMERHDFVTGSRYVAGGGLGYGFARRFVSSGANRLARLLLAIPLRECTTSFRGFRRTLLERVLRSRIDSNGYAFFLEVAWLVTRLTPDVAEFPIYFPDRTAGASKISKREILCGATTLGRLFLQRIRNAATAAGGDRPA